MISLISCYWQSRDGRWHIMSCQSLLPFTIHIGCHDRMNDWSLHILPFLTCILEPSGANYHVSFPHCLLGCLTLKVSWMNEVQTWNGFLTDPWELSRLWTVFCSINSGSGSCGQRLIWNLSCLNSYVYFWIVNLLNDISPEVAQVPFLSRCFPFSSAGWTQICDRAVSREAWLCPCGWGLCTEPWPQAVDVLGQICSQ